jgi:hypothetical protein
MNQFNIKILHHHGYIMAMSQQFSFASDTCTFT